MKENTIKKFMKAMSNVHKGERGMTGLETAIILIAFVTVAAVFGYAVLSAGLFSAERGKETIYAGLEQAKSNMELTGSVIAKGSGTGDNATVTNLIFTVKNSIAGNPIDLTPNSGATQGKNKCIITLRTKDSYYNNIAWSFAPVGNDNGNNLLEVGEQFEITVDMTALGGTFSDPQLGANGEFTMQMKPVLGSTITIQRLLPPQIIDIMDLH